MPENRAKAGVTPGQTVGPFFHYALPFTHGHQLVSPSTAGAVRLHGRVLDGNGAPVPDALIEIRQADSVGSVPAVEGSLRRDGDFTGWGRVPTDAAGRYAFTTMTPAPTEPDSPPFFAVVVFARGLLDRLFTRVYLPEVDEDLLPASVPPERRRTLVAARDADTALRFDIRLQGTDETVFFSFPGHAVS